MTPNKKSVALHCCCAPCTIMPLESLLHAGWQPSLLFYNPNIQPETEYQRRLATMSGYLATIGLSLQVGPYDVELWEEKVGVFGGPYPLIKGAEDYEVMKEAKKRRCRACYDLRFGALADYAETIGSRHLEATISISPYQFTQEVLEALGKNATARGLESLGTDWRAQYQDSVNRSRSLALYRQKYCGCRFSQEEADLERMKI